MGCAPPWKKWRGFMGSLSKKILDYSLALLLLILCGPLLLILWLLLSLSFKEGAIFRQKRPGKNGRIFSIFKFRTMNNEKGASGELLPDEQRLTPMGKIVRKLSLDELPQIFNILKGEMSFVGPRPLLVEYLSLYSERQMKRHNVLPGITGLAQVSGRNDISWEKKLDLDVQYVENWSFLLDLKIIFKTFIKVLKREGVSLKGHSTTTKFQGTKK